MKHSQNSRKSFLTSVSLAMVLLILLAGCNSDLPSSIAGLLDQPEVTTKTALANKVEPTTITTSGLSADSPKLVAAQDGTLEQIYVDVGPSVVHIQVIKNEPALPNGHLQIPGFPDLPGLPNQPNAPDSPDQPFVRGEGSGFVWDKKGHIITNNHVIESAEKITVVFSDETIVDAELVGADSDSDLAVLKVDLPAEKLQPVTLGDSTELRVGDLAIAIGNPFGQEGTMTAGIISALGRLLPVDAADPLAPRFNIPDIIQTDASINPGNSGGVLLNDRGEVVGVTTAIISASQASAGIGFAVPSAIVQKVVPVLIADGRYEHPFLGISGTSLTPDLAEAMDLPTDQQGVLVSEVTAGGPSEKAGLRGSEREVEIDGLTLPVGGDVIIAIDGQTVEQMDELIAYLERNTAVGQEVELTVLRDGENMSLTVTLVARPERSEASITAVPPVGDDDTRVGAWLGIAGLTVSPEIAGVMDLPADQTGVLIQEVQPDSPAEAAGLKGGNQPVTVNGIDLMVGGDIIVAMDGVEVSDIQTLVRLVSQADPGDRVTLSLLRDGQQLDIDVTLEEPPS